MKQFRGFSGALAATVALVVVQPASAAPNQVTDVQVSPNSTGIDVVLKTQSTGDKMPQVFNTNRGNTWTAFVFNTQLASNQLQRKDNPAPGIASVTVSPVSNGVQVTVVGQGSAPIGQVIRKDKQGVVLSVNPGAQPTTIAQAPIPGSQPATPMPPAMGTTPAATTPPSTPIAPFVPTPVAPRTAPSAPTNPVPPLLPRAVAPPVGDMAVSQIDTTPSAIDLGSSERIPRLVLRDAPVREVLSLLARAAGMNLAYSESGGAAAGAAGAAGAASQSGGPTISLDIENESVQDVFNYVLRIACVPAGGASAGGSPGGGGQCNSLEANRVGRTIFVGPHLPDDARNTITRTIRLNQASAASAATFLATQGAEAQRTVEKVTIEEAGGTSSGGGGGGGGGSGGSGLSGVESTTGGLKRTTETRETQIQAVRAQAGDAPLLLRGLGVSTDERLNSLTLVGSPRKIAIATSLLTQLDARKRQASVQVAIVDVNLLGLNKANTSFSFGINDTKAIQDGGVAVINLGSNSPAQLSTADPFGNIGRTFTSGGPNFFSVGSRWLGQLQYAIQHQDAKVLTDPTLTIQEGQQAQVKVVEEVVTNLSLQTQSTSANTATTTLTAEKSEAGLNVQVGVERIDDNGFISMRINPVITAPSKDVTIALAGNSNTITLLQRREVSTGLVRIRDGQTLVLTGVIQDSDKTTVTKVPILGDIPILGALFRSTSKQSERREVLVLVTPKIIDDSDQATFGYGYTPSKEAIQTLQQNR